MKQPVRSPAELLAPGRALTFANVAEGAEGLVISDLARAIAARPKPPAVSLAVVCRDGPRMQQLARDRKSTRLNSSHRTISYAVFCLKKKKRRTTKSYP